MCVRNACVSLTLFFSQKCNRLHPLAAFQGAFKTCTAKLELHNSRRRAAYAARKQGAGAGGGEEAEEGEEEAGEGEAEAEPEPGAGAE